MRLLRLRLEPGARSGSSPMAAGAADKGSSEAAIGSTWEALSPQTAFEPSGSAEKLIHGIMKDGNRFQSDANIHRK